MWFWSNRAFAKITSFKAGTFSHSGIFCCESQPVKYVILFHSVRMWHDSDKTWIFHPWVRRFSGVAGVLLQVSPSSRSTDLEIRVTHGSTDGSLYRPRWRILEQAHLISTKHWLCLFSLPLARRPVVYLLRDLQIHWNISAYSFNMERRGWCLKAVVHTAPLLFSQQLFPSALFLWLGPLWASPLIPSPLGRFGV